MTRGVWQIFTGVLESLKIEILMASFFLKFKMYELKIDMKNMTDFYLNTQKSQKFAL